MLYNQLILKKEIYMVIKLQRISIKFNLINRIHLKKINLIYTKNDFFPFNKSIFCLKNCSWLLKIYKLTFFSNLKKIN